MFSRQARKVCIQLQIKLKLKILTYFYDSEHVVNPYILPFWNCCTVMQQYVTAISTQSEHFPSFEIEYMLQNAKCMLFNMVLFNRIVCKTIYNVEKTFWQEIISNYWGHFAQITFQVLDFGTTWSSNFEISYFQSWWNCCWKEWGQW